MKFISGKFKSDLRLASEIVWIIYSVIVLGIVLITFFVPETLLNISPVCISKSRFGTECFMCGMTRAFTEISKGNFHNADDLNNFSIYLFGLFILNSLFFIYYLHKNLRTLTNSKNMFHISKN
ncbi:MAG: DUF2752 domain-containing protein [Ignavibacteria bacterium]|nr:DUF2752 domain-containing protein [Ignavibacteria bacterium]